MRPTELMVAAAAREIRDGELVFVGMRLPLLAFMLAKKTHAPRAVGLFENGLIRDEATSRLLFTMSDPPNVRGAMRATDMLEVMGLLQSGRVGLGFVGAAEVDRFGNLNTTRVLARGKPLRLPGSGGASDIASLAGRLAVILKHERHRFVERVSYVTSPGYGEGGDWRARVGLVRGGPVAVITDRGVLRFAPGTHEAVLASYHALDQDSSPRSVAEATGFPLAIAEDCGKTPTPTREELELLRSFDPEGFWLGGAP